LGNFVFKKKKNKYGGTVAQGVFLTYKCWYKPIIVCQRVCHGGFCGGTDGVFTSFFAFMRWHSYKSWYPARGTFLVFFVNKYCPKISLIC